MTKRILLNGRPFGDERQRRIEELEDALEGARENVDLALWALVIACCIGGLGWVLWLLN